MPRFKPLPKGRRAPEFEEVRPGKNPRPGGAGLPELRRQPPAPATRAGKGIPPACWRVSRVARHLDVSRKRVYQMVEEGKLEAVRMGPRGLRVLVPSIEAFLDRRRVEQAGAEFRA